MSEYSKVLILKNKSNKKDKILKICQAALFAAISVILVFVHFPIFPSAPYLEYDMADVPILLATLSLGPFYGLGVLTVASLIQAFFLGGNGIIGFIMHLVASGALVLASGFLYNTFNKQITTLEKVDMGGNIRHIIASADDNVFCEYNNKDTRENIVYGIEMSEKALKSLRKLCDIVVLIAGLVIGSLCMTAIMIPLNLIFTPILFKLPVSEVKALILPILVPFNLIKSLANSIIAFLLFVPIKKILKQKI